MMHSRNSAIVPFRVLAMLVCWCRISMVSADASLPCQFDDSRDIAFRTSEVAEWQPFGEALPPPISDLDNPEAPYAEELTTSPRLANQRTAPRWSWHWLPEGLIYHSTMAGVHEPRMALVSFYEASDGRTLWDATLGGRVGLIQYGNGDPVSPVGYQLDFYGAAIARLDVDNRQNLDSTDYVFGLPLTIGDKELQFKIGYAHISSHLGDEYAILHPGSLAQRINYVRDSIEFGASYYWNPAWRLYGEVDWAFHRSGGARPLAFEFGTEYSEPGPTGRRFTPFMAINARLRQEHNYGGDLAVQAGWLRRNLLDHTLRFGLHYYNGKSSQSQFFTTSEEQIGAGVWYDF